MGQALYRKYRSKSLEEIAGQQHVTNILARALKSGHINHAYLLTGPRGVGKTSIARILAHEINQLPYNDDNHLDIIEIDAASNNGVDDVRDLREKVRLAPVSASKKVYIIDEVHMLSKPAFNALLKTLEEPPEHVVFILATTEVHKLPATILSRTQRFHFRPISEDVMKNHLQTIAKKENINIEDDALTVIVERADGSFRDGISLLDQLRNISDGKISAELVEETLGLAPKKQLDRLVQAIIDTNLEEALKQLKALEESGVSPVVLSEQLVTRLRPLIVKKPSLIQLIDQLIEVGKSYNPSLKLLAIVALAANTGDVQPAAEKPSRTMALQAAPEPSITTPAPTQKPPLRPSVSVPKKEDEKPTSSVELPSQIDWEKIVDHTRTHHTPLFSVLKNAQAQYEKGILKLHFSYALHKKKLEDGKYRQMLTESLVDLYKTTPKIVLTSGKLPPQDKQAAAVAAIMGGGEEINVE